MGTKLAIVAPLLAVLCVECGGNATEAAAPSSTTATTTTTTAAPRHDASGTTVQGCARVQLDLDSDTLSDVTGILRAFEDSLNVPPSLVVALRDAPTSGAQVEALRGLKSWCDAADANL